MNRADIRDRVSEEIKSLLIGPYDGTDEKVSGRLSLRYLAGILYPVGSTRGQLQQEETPESADTGGGDEFSADSENPLSLANEMLPSSVAISFCVRKGSDVFVEAGGGHYELEEKSPQKWQRHQLPDSQLKINRDESQRFEALGGAGEVRVTRRESNFSTSTEIITVALLNAHKTTDKENVEATKNIEKRIYQVTLSCRAEGGILPYEDVSSNIDDLEEEVLALQYSQNNVFAVGHGASVSWESDGSLADNVSIDYAPSARVYRPIFDSLQLDDGRAFESSEVLRLGYLASPDTSKNDAVTKLKAFINFYGEWIELQKSISVTPRYERSRDYLISAMSKCFDRMHRSVDLLKQRDDCWQAFQLANAAMLIQMDQNDRINTLRSARSSTGKSWPIPADEAIHPGDNTIPDQLPNSWRPFQLAFFLLTMFDLEHPEEEDASTVDLIWFSTGGGKTEAYLLLAAYELIRRRHRFADSDTGSGTGVITRYTLRFLTADQFARTGSLICALEKLRQSGEYELGGAPFSLGLYAGGSVSYNKISEAEQAISKLQNNPAEDHLFQLDYCPNCGTSLLPSEPKFDENGEPDLSQLGYSIVENQVHVHCTNDFCLFSNSTGLPIKTVDEDIFETPPSFLLGTVDKFANFAFGKREGSIFKGADGKKAPPSLIIQDELHLISGPLGTIAAVYESAFDAIIRFQNRALGFGERGPKYIASSATVRDSDTQIQRLLGRSSAIFPPRGISSADSFFSKEDRDLQSSRLYMGIMAQGLNSTSAAHWTAAAMLQAVRGVCESNSLSAKEIDFLWSLVCYCNSKRELGLINASTNDEILSRMRVYRAIQGLDESKIKELRKEEVSSQGVKSISETRGNLLIPLSDNRDTPVRDFIPATNMISVGVDIDRLGAMMINGQPKTTAEYIQASSRVGRAPTKRGPGLVLTLYSPSKPRDRSHYEHFRAYHETLYRLVEPTSVTPGSEQALERALHAAIIISLRHSIKGLNNHPRVNSFEEPETKKILDLLKDRLLAAYPDSSHQSHERETILRLYEQVISHWHHLAEDFTDLVYYSKSRGDHSLMSDFSAKRSSAFPTMRSMRSVDVSIPMKFR